jgi:hypothetical protein
VARAYVPDAGDIVWISFTLNQDTNRLGVGQPSS